MTSDDGIGKKGEPEPWASAIDASSVLGREEPDDEDHQADNHSDKKAGENRQRVTAKPPTPPLNIGDWIFLFVLVGTAITGFVVYTFWGDIEKQYVKHFHPERHWLAEVRAREFSVRLSDIQRRKCDLDLTRARLGEPIEVEELVLLGTSKTFAEKLASENVAVMESLCKIYEDAQLADVARLEQARNELQRAQR